MSFLALLACNDPGAGTSTPNVGATISNVSSQSGQAAPGPVYQFGFAQSALTPVGGTGGTAGAGGSAAQAGSAGSIAAPKPSTRCGDAIVGDAEECDDGNEGDDGCTAACQTRDQLAVPPPAVAPERGAGRVQGIGRHPLAGGSSGFISVYVEPDGDEPLVGATVYNELGQAKLRGVASLGSQVVTDANPVAAALPNGEYAVAWNDFNGDGSDLGVALRKVQASGDLGSLRAANQHVQFSQQDPDMVWTGESLVVAWVDYTDAEAGPDIRYRSFDADLNPLSDEQTLADLPTWEADVALARFEAGWAAAYREGTDDGHEYIVVKNGDKSWRLGPILGGPEGEKPALVELDQTHLLVAFSIGTDPTASGTANTSRLRYSVVDTTSGGAPMQRALSGPDSTSSSTQGSWQSQTSPALERGMDGVFLAWRTEAAPGDAAADQIWLKSLGWSPRGAAGALELEEHDAELLIPRLCESSTGDQRAPALARTSLYPNGALALAWDDYSHSLDARAGDPDVVVHYAPDHTARQSATVPALVTETWTGDYGTAWPARWQPEYDATAVKPMLYHNAGDFHALSGASSSTAIAMLQEPLALDTDVAVTYRATFTSVAAGVVLRRSPADPSSYLLAKVSSVGNEPWRLQAVNAGVATDLATMTQPPNFYAYLGYHSTWRMHVRAVTSPDGSVLFGMRAWPVGQPEPSDWQLSATIPAGSPLIAQLGSKPGRIGLLGQVAAGRDVIFDDFRALYFTGSGNLDAPRNEAQLPLLRSAAAYRTCRPGAVCSNTEGCCTGDQDCAAGLSCLATQGAFRGLGSHASVCTPSHCGDSQTDADEVFADAGGADCAPRDCTPTAPAGQANYCSQTCPCGIGEGDCIVDSQCMPGLWCGRERLEQYGGTQGLDACVPLNCLNRVKDADETLPDCGGSCGNNCSCSPVNDAHWHCRVYCPCALGNGQCQQDDECQPGLVCAFLQGAKYGLSPLHGVCTNPHCVNGKKDTLLGETSIDLGGPCSSPTGLTLADAMADFPSMHYRKVSYGLETYDYLAMPTATPLSGQVTTPVFRTTQRFLFNVPVAVDTTMTFNVGSVAGLANPAVDLKLYNQFGTLVKSATVPQGASTAVALGRLGGNYDLDVIPHDPTLTYSITRSVSAFPSMGVKDGVDFSDPSASLYFYVPAEVDNAFLIGNFDAAAGVHFYEPNGAEVSPIAVNSKVYGLATHGLPGVWRTTFKTTSQRAHLVNLPDIFSFDPRAVFGSNIIRTDLAYGPPPSSAYTTHYLRNANRFLFHLSAAGSPVFSIQIDDTVQRPTEVRVSKLDGNPLPTSPFSLPVGIDPIPVGQLDPGDYVLELPTPTATMRYKLTTPLGVQLFSIDGFNTGNVWLASNRDYFYVPQGVTSVRFGSSNATSIFKLYTPTGALAATQPTALGNGVFELQTPTSGTWSLNVQGQTVIRMLTLTQAIGFEPTLQVTPAPSPPCLLCP